MEILKALYQWKSHLENFNTIKHKGMGRSQTYYS